MAQRLRSARAAAASVVWPERRPASTMVGRASALMLMVSSRRIVVAVL
jgi:hypothetical protein